MLVALSNLVWSRFRFADESVKLMLLIFPELSHSTNIKFMPASKKGIRRIRSSEANPNPLEEAKWSHTFLDRRIRKNLAEVASVAMFYLPRHYESVQRSLSITPTETWQCAVTGARGCSSWKECRLHVMRSFVHAKQNVQVSVPSLGSVVSAQGTSKRKDGRPGFPDLLSSEQFPDVLPSKQ